MLLLSAQRIFDKKRQSNHAKEKVDNENDDDEQVLLNQRLKNISYESSGHTVQVDVLVPK